MRPSHRICTALVAVATVVLAVGAGLATPAGPAWSRISGPVQAGSQLGLARTSGGVLHVIWNRGNSSTSIFETRLSPAGKAVGTSTVATGWQGNGGLALVEHPEPGIEAGGERMLLQQPQAEAVDGRDPGRIELAGQLAPPELSEARADS